MGCHPNITATKMPKAGAFVGMRTIVHFHYDLDVGFPATVVRDDREAPFLTIIRLDDGRHVLSTECQYSHPTAPEPPGGPVCTLAWVEERALEIRRMRRDAYGDAFSRYHHGDQEARQRTLDESNAKEASLYAAIVGAIAFSSCEPDAVAVCQAASKLGPEPEEP